VKKRKSNKSPRVVISDKEIIGIDHPLTDRKLVTQLLPEGGRVPLSELSEVVFLLTHPAEFEMTPFAKVKALASSLNAAVDRDFRAAQERNVRETGKARP